MTTFGEWYNRASAQMPDYLAMDGAEFRRAAGADPEKWAEAFMQRQDAEFIDVVNMAAWFRMAMAAAAEDALNRLVPGHDRLHAKER